MNDLTIRKIQNDQLSSVLTDTQLNTIVYRQEDYNNYFKEIRKQFNFNLKATKNYDPQDFENLLCFLIASGDLNNQHKTRDIDFRFISSFFYDTKILKDNGFVNTDINDFSSNNIERIALCVIKDDVTNPTDYIYDFDGEFTKTGKSFDISIKVSQYYKLYVIIDISDPVKYQEFEKKITEEFKVQINESTVEIVSRLKRDINIEEFNPETCIKINEDDLKNTVDGVFFIDHFNRIIDNLYSDKDKNKKLYFYNTKAISRKAGILEKELLILLDFHDINYYKHKEIRENLSDIYSTAFKSYASVINSCTVYEFCIQFLLHSPNIIKLNNTISFLARLDNKSLLLSIKDSNEDNLRLNKDNIKKLSLIDPNTWIKECYKTNSIVNIDLKDNQGNIYDIQSLRKTICDVVLSPLDNFFVENCEEIIEKKNFELDLSRIQFITDTTELDKNTLLDLADPDIEDEDEALQEVFNNINKKPYLLIKDLYKKYNRPVPESIQKKYPELKEENINNLTGIRYAVENVSDLVSVRDLIKNKELTEKGLGHININPVRVSKGLN